MESFVNIRYSVKLGYNELYWTKFVITIYVAKWMIILGWTGKFCHYIREFVIAVIVITKPGCSWILWFATFFIYSFSSKTEGKYVLLPSIDHIQISNALLSKGNKIKLRKLYCIETKISTQIYRLALHTGLPGHKK